MDPAAHLSPQQIDGICATTLLRGDAERWTTAPICAPPGVTIYIHSYTRPAWSYNYVETISVPTFVSVVWARALVDEALFQLLLEKWRVERGATSSISEIVMCPAYQEIIGMGQRAVPLMLRQLQIEGKNPDHWGWALHAITGENPVPRDAAGDLRKIADAWLSWGSSRYAW